MVYIGRSKFGSNNRISLVEGLPDVMNLEIGDYVEFHIENGQLILRKETKKYNGFDFESEEIHDNLVKMEKAHIPDPDEYDHMDPEAREQRAYNQYLKDKAAREARKKNGE